MKDEELPWASAGNEVGHLLDQCAKPGGRLPFHQRGTDDSLCIQGDVEISPRAILYTHLAPSSFVTRDAGRIIIGPESFVNCGAWFRSTAEIRIGARCRIGPFVRIYDHDAHEVARPHREGGRSAPVSIGDEVWLGVGVIVLKGVTIGDGSVVGAGAVVTRDVKPGVVVVPDMQLREVGRT